MQLEGSCHCGNVKFSVNAPGPVPYMHCYCSICRKTQGGGGFAINLLADADSLQVEGRNHISVYRAVIDGEQSPAERNFCSNCGSGLWAWDPRWPELLHPFASAIDNELPAAPERVHIMQDFRKSWVPAPASGEPRFAEYPDESLEAWHRRHGLLDD